MRQAEDPRRTDVVVRLVLGDAEEMDPGAVGAAGAAGGLAVHGHGP